MNKVQVIGTGSYVPPKIVTNDDLSLLVDTNDEWIRSRTGIRERRISEGEDTSSMALKATLKAMERANVKPEELDLIIVGTATPDNFMPSVACMIQDRIKAMNATCFDISAACTGLIYGMCIAEKFIRTGSAKVALVIGAETLSKIIDWKDRSTCVLFGDGASAVILQQSEKDGILASYTGSDGSKGNALTCNAVPIRSPYVISEIDYANRSLVRMDGREIFKFAVKTIASGVEKLLQETGCSMDDIKYIVPHQANYRIIESAAKKLNVNIEKFYLNLDRYANTSAATIGLALDELIEKDLLKSGDKIILIGFGGGLTYGGLIFQY